MKLLESQKKTNYPLRPTGDPAEIEVPQTASQKGEIQGHYPRLKAEIEAEGIDGQLYAQR